MRGKAAEKSFIGDYPGKDGAEICSGAFVLCVHRDHLYQIVTYRTG